MMKILENNGTIKSITDVDYKTIELNDDILKRWESIDLLDGLNDDLKKKCALSYERMAAYIFNEMEIDNEHGCIKGEEYNLFIAFPCVRRIVVILNDDIMPENVIRNLNRTSKWLFNENVIEKISEACGCRIDFEAELVLLVVSGFVERVISDGKYKIIKSD